MNLPLKNKKIFCRIKSFFASDRTKNILKSKKTKAIVVGLFLVAVFSLAFFVFSSDIVSAQNTIPNGQPSTKEKTGWVAGIGIDIIKAVLQLVEKFLSWVFGLTATLFGVVVSPGNISGDHGILNQPVIGEIWMMTRDTMNMFFILVLLFSAFCTIFQVEKWNLKKIWLNILINALLVNFSFPIARFFIDVSNVAMYYFINNLFDVTGADGSGIFAAISSNSSVTELLYKGAGSEIDKLVGQFSNIIFMFILVMTLLVIAVLFTIRLIFLTLLVMFSPIGFVGYIFPSTAKYADKWWENLFSYSFFGPIMIFGIAIAIKIAQAFNANRGAFSKGGYTNAPSSSDANWVASAAFFVIPIIVLWVVMGIAKSMGIAGAEMVVGKAQSFAKSAGMWAAKAPWRATKLAANATGIPGGIKKGWEETRKSGKFLGFDNRLTNALFKDTKELREARGAGLISGGDKGYYQANQEFMRREANEMREKWKKSGGASDEEINRGLGSKNQALKLAAALEAAEKNGFGDDAGGAALKKYQEAAKAIASDPVYENLFKEKVKDKHIRFVIQDEINTKGITSAADINDVYAKHLGGLNASKIAAQKDLFGKDTAAINADAVNYFKSRASSNEGKKFVRKSAEQMPQKDREILKSQGLPV